MTTDNAAARIATAALAASLTSDTIGQDEWRERFAIPPARHSCSLTFDAARNVVILFGGASPNQPGVLADTWEWNGTAWNEYTPANSPPPRFGHSAAFDSSRNEVVIFGGRDAVGSPLADTWIWDGDNWTQQTSATHPQAGHDHAMVYDQLRDRIVLFGGNPQQAGTNVPSWLGETWLWDGSTRSWTLATPALSPSPRWDHDMTWDPDLGAVWLFGGVSATAWHNDLWSWNGSAWTLVDGGSASGPSSRIQHRISYDRACSRILLAGGQAPSNGQRLNDTWTWDTGSARWKRACNPCALPPRAEFGMTYDSNRGTTVAFGGYDGQTHLADHWEYGLRSRIEEIGAGCPGALGVPSLTAGSPPIIGQQLSMLLARIPPLSSLVLMVIGFQKTSVDLTPHGAPGCFLFATLDIIEPMSIGNPATWTLHIPPSATLQGLELALQAGVPAPGVNPLGFITSNGIAVTIGSK